MNSTTIPAAGHAGKPQHGLGEYSHYRIVPARHPWRIVGTVLALLVIGSILQSIFSNPHWAWAVFAQWFFSEPVLVGLGLTLWLTVLGTVIGLVLGAAIALARISRSPLLSGLAWGYIWLFRSIPILVLLLVINNLGYLYENITIGLPFTGLTFFSYPTTQFISPFVAVLIGLSLNQAAFSAEIIRGGLLSVDIGQLEAAAALGLSRPRQVLRIILPQAMRAIVPGAFNDIIALAKNTANAYILALPELFYTVMVIYRRNLEVIPLLMVATAWYAIIQTALSGVQILIERRFARGALRNSSRRVLPRLAARLRTPVPAGASPGVPPGAPVQAAVDTAASAAAARSGAASAAAASAAAASVTAAASTAAATPVTAVSATGVPAITAALVLPRWADTARGGEVSIHGVSKSFGALKVLDDLTLTIASGSVTAILGPSGSGKSTLLRCINHLERVDDGFIAIDGELVGYRRDGDTLYELKERDILRRRADAGMVFQSFNLFPHLTVLQNLIEAPIAVRGTSRADATALALDLLARVGLSDKTGAYPRQLSGGQQQRVAIARALALKPKVVLFDEPTSALDPELVGEVLAVIKELARSGTTLVIVTHEVGFAREVADTVVFMEQGRFLDVGSPAKVFNAPDHPRTAEFLARVL